MPPSPSPSSVRCVNARRYSILVRHDLRATFTVALPVFERLDTPWTVWAITIGFFVFLAVGGFMLIAAATIGVRRWWYLRKNRGKSPGERPEASQQGVAGRIIEGEYQEVRYREETRRKP